MQAFQNAMMFPKRAMALRGGQDPAKEGDVVPDVIFKARVRDEKVFALRPMLMCCLGQALCFAFYSFCLLHHDKNPWQIGGDNPFTWKDVSTADLFKGKRVVIFSLPGAFTPTCSSTHLPGYEEHYEVSCNFLI
jgi:peroxiredoxin